jgi:transcriptional regulator with PAS, ATPase and Fis domain
MPLEMQAKILRVLQDRVVTPVGGQSSYQVNIRILAATPKIGTQSEPAPFCHFS